MNRGAQPHHHCPYAVLNLPSHNDDDKQQKQPISDDKIRDAYKRLSRVLHPDKRPPGKERDDAQELFSTLQHAYETLQDPALRQAYDTYGHYAVTVVRHNRYSENSLYCQLSKLHDEGKSSEALEVLQIVLEDNKRKQYAKEWELNAHLEINMHAGEDMLQDWPDVSSTNLSLTASVPMPTQTSATDGDKSNQTTKKQKMQLSIGGQSNLDKGLGSTSGVLSATYKPVEQTDITSDISIGRNNIETSVYTSTQLSNGTRVVAKMNRQYEIGSDEEGIFGLQFQSSRSLTMFEGRTVVGSFALGLNGSNLKMTHGILSATTWGFGFEDKDSDKPLPCISTKLIIGSPFPLECTIDQSHLFDCPHRGGRVSVACSPIQGYKIKAALSRKLYLRHCKYHHSEYASSLVIGVEHTGMSGLKWVIRYQRPEGLTIRIPIFVSSFLSHAYWNKVIWVSAMSFLFDETLEELIGYPSSDMVNGETEAVNEDRKISLKMQMYEKEREWLNSSKAKRYAEQQASFISSIAKLKRQQEDTKDGLVIMKATYASSNSSLDVTNQLQYWVLNSQLYLPPSPKNLLVGFYDLVTHKRSSELLMTKKYAENSVLSKFANHCIVALNVLLSRLNIGYTNHKKNDKQKAATLTVRYKYKRGVYEKTVTDNDALMLPGDDDATIRLGSSSIVS